MGWLKISTGVVLLGLGLGAAGCGRTVAEGDPETLVKTGWEQFRLGEYKRAAARFQAS